MVRKDGGLYMVSPEQQTAPPSDGTLVRFAGRQGIATGAPSMPAREAAPARASVRSG